MQPTGPYSFSKEFLEKTIKTWQPYSPDPLSLQDAEEIANNTIELVKYLSALKDKYVEVS